LPALASQAHRGRDVERSFVLLTDACLHGRSTKRTLCSAANSFARLRASSRASCVLSTSKLFSYSRTTNQRPAGPEPILTHLIPFSSSVSFCSTQHYFFLLCGTSASRGSIRLSADGPVRSISSGLHLE